MKTEAKEGEEEEEGENKGVVDSGNFGEVGNSREDWSIFRLHRT